MPDAKSAKQKDAEWTCTNYGPLNGNTTLFKCGDDHLSWVGAAAYLNALQQQVADLRQGLERINGIRNNIISSQTVNWSRDIYPLVAALNDAGFKGKLRDVYPHDPKD